MNTVTLITMHDCELDIDYTRIYDKSVKTSEEMTVTELQYANQLYYADTKTDYILPDGWSVERSTFGDLLFFKGGMGYLLGEDENGNPAIIGTPNYPSCCITLKPVK